MDSTGFLNFAVSSATANLNGGLDESSSKQQKKGWKLSFRGMRGKKILHFYSSI